MCRRTAGSPVAGRVAVLLRGRIAQHPHSGTTRALPARAGPAGRTARHSATAWVAQRPDGSAHEAVTRVGADSAAATRGRGHEAPARLDVGRWPGPWRRCLLDVDARHAAGRHLAEMASAVTPSQRAGEAGGEPRRDRPHWSPASPLSTASTSVSTSPSCSAGVVEGVALGDGPGRLAQRPRPRSSRPAGHGAQEPVAVNTSGAFTTRPRSLVPVTGLPGVSVIVHPGDRRASDILPHVSSCPSR